MTFLPEDWRRPEVLAPEAGLHPVLAAYLRTLESRPSTWRAYGAQLRAALRDLEAVTLADLAPWRLEAWRERLLQDGRSPATHAQALSAMRSFLLWMADQLGQDLPRAVLRALKGPRRRVLKPYEVLSEAELAALLASVADHLRDRALLAVLLGAGLRASEAVALDGTDLHLDGAGEWYLHIRQAKGGKDRKVPLRADVAAACAPRGNSFGRRTAPPPNEKISA